MSLADTEPGARHWSWSQVNDLAMVLHPIASAAADLLVGDDLLRVKRCARSPWLFPLATSWGYRALSG